MALLTQNSELREIGVWNWSLPAWVVTLTDGTAFNTCPSAGACAQLCYARNGTYLFPAVRAAHIRNLERTLQDGDGWQAEMTAELDRPRFRPSGRSRHPVIPPDAELDGWAATWAESGGAAVRIHDAGDFYDDTYTGRWLEIARAVPDVLFYAYTKEVERFRRLVEPAQPANFRFIYSLGGRQDSKLNLDADRHAEVFPDAAAIAAAGYRSQEESDLYAVLLPTTRVGIPANNIPQFRRRQGDATFGTLQAARHGTLEVRA